MKDMSRPLVASSLRAHTPNKENEWHDLLQHLSRVADLTGQFAGAFGEADWGYIIGILHDIGKSNPEFQSYLLAEAEGEYHSRVPHAWGGAALAYVFRKQLPWEEIALTVAGHHSGLEEPGILSRRLVSHIEGEPELVGMYREVLEYILQKTTSKPPVVRQKSGDRLKQEFKIRMLFSALVDADRLDTEEHFDRDKSALRRIWAVDIPVLWERFRKNQEKLLATVDSATTVNQVRNEVYEACIKSAKSQQGLYRLTVPTGGGKTRSALAFALCHALNHGLRRVVVAMPYTSIIDQTAKVYREILGDGAVLEHHSQAVYGRVSSESVASGKGSHLALSYELATENWDAPVIVTTTVQLFESLFSNHPSRCRKIHNLARSVIILDEVQTLPPEILRSTLDAIRVLVEDCGVSVVFCTATQPALQSTPFLNELKSLKMQEIVPGYGRHFQALKRVEYEVRQNEQPLESIAEEIASEHQILVILNTRKQALELFSLLSERESVCHLSTMLCGAHRRHVLAEVTHRLRKGEPLCLISTQVVEAGVDLDFPAVYRALGPLDRIVQAAGRCNREGRRAPGRVVVFRPKGGRSPKGPYAAGMEKARLLLEKHPIRLHEPSLYEEYFQQLFHDLELDKYNIQEFRAELNYPAVAERYRLIVSDTVSVVVPYQDAFNHLQQWLMFPSRDTLRLLQLYLVNLFKWEALKLESEGWLTRVAEGLFRWEGGYDQRRGIVQAVYDPADLIG